jgi:hypothetical protein
MTDIEASQPVSKELESAQITVGQFSGFFQFMTMASLFLFAISFISLAVYPYDLNSAFAKAALSASLVLLPAAVWNAIGGGAAMSATRYAKFKLKDNLINTVRFISYYLLIGAALLYTGMGLFYWAAYCLAEAYGISRGVEIALLTISVFFSICPLIVWQVYFLLR